MKYYEAKHIACNYLNKHHHSLTNNPEFAASLTHHILNPDICPPEMLLTNYKYPDLKHSIQNKEA